MNAKTVLVTGASDGIGLATARGLAKRGAQVVLLCRNPGKAEQARATVAREAAAAPPEVILADLASLEDVRSAADEFLRRWERLDVLINNAGALNGRRRDSRDGIELTFAVNHLAGFLLTRQLLPALVRAGSARILNVSSDLHRQSQLDLDNLLDPPRYDAWSVYADSKLCNVLFSYRLAAGLSETGIRVNALHPGVVATSFARGSHDMRSLALRAARWTLRSPDSGAKCSLELATSDALAEVTGCYFDENARPVRSSASSYDSDLAEALWKICESACGCSFDPPAGDA